MPRVAYPRQPGRVRLIRAVSDEFRRVERLRPQLQELEDEELARINVAQNVLRDCLSAVLIEMLPYSHTTPIELARRMASYALSVVPIEDQEMVVAAMLDGFADFHMHRTASRAVIEAEWEMHDGTTVPNYPENQK